MPYLPYEKRTHVEKSKVCMKKELSTIQTEILISNKLVKKLIEDSVVYLIIANDCPPCFRSGGSLRTFYAFWASFGLSVSSRIKL